MKSLRLGLLCFALLSVFGGAARAQRVITKCTVWSFTASLANTGFTDYSDHHQLSWTTSGCARVTIDGKPVGVSGTMMASDGEYLDFGTIRYVLRAFANNGVVIERDLIEYFSDVDSAETPGRAMPTYAPGATNVELARWKVDQSAVSQVYRGLWTTFRCAGSALGNVVSNVRYVVNGVTLNASRPAYGCGTEVDPLAISDLPFAPGETKTIYVYGDIAGNAPDGEYGVNGVPTSPTKRFAANQYAADLSFAVHRNCDLATASLSTATTIDYASVGKIAADIQIGGCKGVVEVNSGNYTRRYTPANGHNVFDSTYRPVAVNESSVHVTLMVTNTDESAIRVFERDIAITNLPAAPAANQCQLSNVKVTPVAASGGTAVVSWTAPAGCIVYIDRWTATAANDEGFDIVPLIHPGPTHYYPASGSAALPVGASPVAFYVSAQAGSDQNTVLWAAPIVVPRN